jgi:hypothetical protein
MTDIDTTLAEIERIASGPAFALSLSCDMDNAPALVKVKTLAGAAPILAAEVRRLRDEVAVLTSARDETYKTMIAAQTELEFEHQRFLEESALRFAAEHVIKYVTTSVGKVKARLYDERKREAGQ